MTDAEISQQVIGAAIAVHRELGPGLLESMYEACMTVEMLERGLEFLRQHPVPMVYKSAVLDCGFRIDFLVEKRLIVELKSVESLHGIHEAQMLSYLKATRCRYGLLLNFNVRYLKDGIRRMVLDPPSVPSVPLW